MTLYFDKVQQVVGREQCSLSWKVTLGLASHFRCVTHSVVGLYSQYVMLVLCATYTSYSRAIRCNNPKLKVTKILAVAANKCDA